MTRHIILKVNGADRSIRADPAMPLLWALREELTLTASAACACKVSVEAAENSGRVEFEVLACAPSDGPGELHPVQRIWIDMQVPHCGHCQSGMIMAVVALLLRNPMPTDDEVGQAITKQVSLS